MRLAKASNGRELITDLFLIHTITSALCIIAAKVIIVIIYIASTTVVQNIFAIEKLS